MQPQPTPSLLEKERALAAYLGPDLWHEWQDFSPLEEERVASEKPLLAARRRFHFAAAFWNFFWFLHRRLYGIGLLYMLAFLALGQLAHKGLDSFLPRMATEGVIIICSALFTGFVAHPLYRWGTMRRINRVVARSASQEEALHMLGQRMPTCLACVLWPCGLIFIALFLSCLWLYWQDPLLFKEALWQALGY